MNKQSPKLTKSEKQQISTTETIDECKRLLSLNNNKKASQILQKLADNDNPEACFMLCELYEKGLGVNKSYEQFLNYLAKAVELQDPSAELKFATMIAPFHKPGKFDYKACAKELAKAAEHNNAKAILELGKLYFAGHGVPQDITKAIELINKAADLDQTINRNEQIGTCYYTEVLLDEALPYLKNAYNEGCYEVCGILSAYFMRGVSGIEQNLEIAYGILKQGAAHNNGLSEYILGTYYRENADFKRTIHYFTQSHQHKFPEAAYELANVLLKQLYCTSNDRRNSFKLLREAATYPCLNHVDAIADLGTLYYEGLGTIKNYEEAIKCFDEVLDINPNHTIALFGKANCLIYGNGCEKNISEGIKLLDKASELGDFHATTELYNYYSLGEIVDKDEKLFFKYLAKAAEQSDDIANFRLYQIYKEGSYGVTKDDDLAEKYLKTSFNLGNEYAILELTERFRKEHPKDEDLYSTVALANDRFCYRNEKYQKLENGNSNSYDAAYLAVRDMLGMRYRLGLPTIENDKVNFDEDDLDYIPLPDKV